MYTVARKCRDFSPGAMGQRAARRPSELLSALGASARGGRPRSIRPPIMDFSGVDWHQVTGMTPEAAERAPTEFKKRCKIHKTRERARFKRGFGAALSGAPAREANPFSALAGADGDSDGTVEAEDDDPLPPDPQITKSAAEIIRTGGVGASVDTLLRLWAFRGEWSGVGTLRSDELTVLMVCSKPERPYGAYRKYLALEAPLMRYLATRGNLGYTLTVSAPSRHMFDCAVHDIKVYSDDRMSDVVAKACREVWGFKKLALESARQCKLVNADGLFFSRVGASGASFGAAHRPGDLKVSDLCVWTPFRARHNRRDYKSDLILLLPNKIEWRFEKLERRHVVAPIGVTTFWSGGRRGTAGDPNRFPRRSTRASTPTRSNTCTTNTSGTESPARGVAISPEDRSATTGQTSTYIRYKHKLDLACFRHVDDLDTPGSGAVPSGDRVEVWGPDLVPPRVAGVFALDARRASRDGRQTWFPHRRQLRGPARPAELPRVPGAAGHRLRVRRRG